ncbi:MAG: YbhB/YbcL family Raf kinase inhibitor-like protein [Candidatus Omnitrophota bacterium]
MKKIYVILLILFLTPMAQALELKSDTLIKGEYIDKQYTGEGLDVSPPLNWSGIPEGTKSFALICDDPDAPVGTWVHWVMYNIPPYIKELGEAIPADEVLIDGSLQGKNDFGRIGYGGPMPPPGKPHRYFFKLYALDTLLDVKPGLTKSQLLEVINGHILTQVQLVGKYKR